MKGDERKQRRKLKHLKEVKTKKEIKLMSTCINKDFMPPDEIAHILLNVKSSRSFYQKMNNLNLLTRKTFRRVTRRNERIKAAR